VIEHGQAIINIRLTEIDKKLEILMIAAIPTTTDLLNELYHIDHKLDRMVNMLNQVLLKEVTIMSLIDDELTKAEAAAAVDTSAVSAVQSLLVTLSTMVANLKAGLTVDPVVVSRIDALAAGISARANALSVATLANTIPPDPGPPVTTPAVPPVVVAPVVPPPAV
jgi:hypothetical protein